MLLTPIRRLTQLRVVMLLLLAVSTLPLSAKDFEYTYEGTTIKYTVISESARTCKTRDGYDNNVWGKYSPAPGNYVSGDIKLPEHPMDGSTSYTLVELGYRAFYNRPDLTSVELPSTVQTMGKYSFAKCTGLTSVNIPSSMTSIGETAFWDCSSLTSIEIPTSVTSIEPSAFQGCSGLTSINIPASVTTIGSDSFVHCTSLTSIEIPSSVTSIGSMAFYGCTALTSINIPSSITVINGATFSGCTSLTAIEIPSSVSELGQDVFSDCTSLASISIPSSITSIERETFSGCTSLTSVNLPATLTSIGRSAFEGCSSLTSIEIPNSLSSLGEYAFRYCESLTSVVIPSALCQTFPANSFIGCPLKPLRLEGCIGLRGLSFSLKPESVIEGVHFDVERGAFWSIEKMTCKSWNHYDFELSPLMYGVRLSPEELTEYNPDIVLEKYSAKFYDASTEEEVSDSELSLSEVNIVRGLEYDKRYNVKVYGYDSSEHEYCLIDREFTTKLPNMEFNAKSTQTSLSIYLSTLSDLTDETCEISEYGIYHDSQKYVYTGEYLVFDNLYPQERFIFTPYIVIDGKEYLYPETTGWTEGWNEKTKDKVVGPTTAVFTASFSEKTAHADDYWWEFDGQKVKSKTLSLTSLKPEERYDAVFYLMYNNKKYEFKEQFTTSKLTLTTLAPKGVSATSAIVAASTNISDLEPMAGFEWKKYDAPASLAPSQGYCAVFNGVLEGYIKNLQTTSYYNVRAFYKDAQGTYYYGEWVTFDPSDFSYFEPTVHTYPVEEVTATSASVRGYALQGTDDIIRQGFQYWKNDGRSSVSARVPSESEISTVLASGQVMTATFENLEDGTTYTYRAFVETANGCTYGDERSFTTIEISGIRNVETESAEPEILGYYDMSGRCYDAPRKGLNIVVYSNGTSRKVFIR